MKADRSPSANPGRARARLGSPIATVASVSAVALQRLSELLIPTARACELEASGTVTAAVLVALYARDGELHTVFTERNRELSRHAGEISFPGGRREPSDQSLVDTALREAGEELGLPRDAVRVIGALPPTSTIATGYAIYPWVGVIDAAHSFTPNVSEVAAVIELPLRTVAAGYGRRTLSRRGIQLRTDTYLVGRHVIWGATARILADLLERTEA